VPRADLGGATYQVHLNAIEDSLAAFEFELGHTSQKAISAMESFDGQGIFETVKYEDMMADSGMLGWHQLFLNLGFTGLELAVCLRAVWENSLFGSFNAGRQSHISSGQSRQWEKNYTPEMAVAFEKAFPDALQKLEYT
jgi:hypothetical protein